MVAPEGEGLRRGIGTGVGGTVGGVGGGVLGGTLGAAGGLGLSALLNHLGVGDEATYGALMGGGIGLGSAIGGIGGAIAGGGAGYDLAGPSNKQAQHTGAHMPTSSDVRFVEGVKTAFYAAGLNPNYTKHYVQYGLEIEKTASAKGEAVEAGSEGVKSLMARLKKLLAGGEGAAPPQRNTEVMGSVPARASEGAPGSPGGPSIMGAPATGPAPAQVGQPGSPGGPPVMGALGEGMDDPSNLLRNLGLGGAGLAGLGGAGAYAMGDADTTSNQLRNMSNNMLGTDFDTQSRLSALFNG